MHRPDTWTVGRRLLSVMALVVFACVAVGMLTAGQNGSALHDPGAGESGAGGMAMNWKSVEKLISEQKMKAALEVVLAIRDAAEAAGDDREWTRALV